MNEKSLKHLEAAQKHQTMGNLSKARKHEIRANELQFGLFSNFSEIEARINQKMEETVRNINSTIEKTAQKLSDQIAHSKPEVAKNPGAAEKHIEIASELNTKVYHLKADVQRLESENTKLRKRINELDPDKQQAYRSLQEQFNAVKSQNEKLGRRHDKLVHESVEHQKTMQELATNNAELTEENTKLLEHKNQLASICRHQKTIEGNKK